ncbi:PLD nuclease N-terminal domain-containing protein [Hymenobacter fodinae]|uniref:PLDc_N domain-containing protein n=1 Tax=Hymenobacter fodinae TaxID=2510796 RepID=A0A4Z0P9G2_9BACT|nr:PLD nuclease N-terminal domain-containing protein [Hymenobacter fodinae]TGE09307.1 PLDc_N domain-containing protein [Hymenobacter fodinae]
MNKIAPYISRLASAAPLLALMLVVSSCSRYSADGSLATWGYVLLALDILALFDVFRQPWSIGKKILWAAIIFFFPLGGLIVYYLFAGRGKAS